METEYKALKKKIDEIVNGELQSIQQEVILYSRQFPYLNRI